MVAVMETKINDKTWWAVRSHAGVTVDDFRVLSSLRRGEASDTGGVAKDFIATSSTLK